MKKNSYFQSYLVAFAGILLMGFMMLSSCKKDNDTNPDKSDNILMFESTAKLSSDEVNSTATGSLTAKYDQDTKKLSYTFTWEGLTGEIAGFHIHKGDGSIIINFKDDGYTTATKGTFSGSSILTNDAWIKDLKANKLYGQIHTANYPAGEIIFPFTKKGSSTNGNDNPPSGGDPNDSPIY